MKLTSLIPVLSLALSVLSVPAAQASSWEIRCSNFQDTIQFNAFSRSLRVLLDTDPSPKYADFKKDEIQFTEQSLLSRPSEKIGCSSRTLEVKQMKFCRKNGRSMPDAYNRGAVDGCLDDLFICASENSWMPLPGQGCETK